VLARRVHVLMLQSSRVAARFSQGIVRRADVRNK
jgi:hypothetical protein